MTASTRGNGPLNACDMRPGIWYECLLTSAESDVDASEAEPVHEWLLFGSNPTASALQHGEPFAVVLQRQQLRLVGGTPLGFLPPTHRTGRALPPCAQEWAQPAALRSTLTASNTHPPTRHSRGLPIVKESFVSSAAAHTSPGPVPDVAGVFAFAQDEILSAAAELWPGARVELSSHIPGVTGYVHRVRVGERELYAKYSFLGLSLVSVLRGIAGDWAGVRRDQAVYIQRADSLPVREAAQLRLLADLGQPRVCAVAGLARGVLFTAPVPGPTLAALLLRDPASTAALFESVFADLHQLHRSRTAQRLAPTGSISERSVAATFQRKFNGISSQTYLSRLGTERCTEAARAEVTALLRAVVARLHRMRPSVLAPGQAVLTYGDLKPEHLVFPDGPGGRPVLIDPGLLRARASVDAAKLTSRTVLLLVTANPGIAVAEEFVQGLGAFAEQRMRPMAPKAARSWLRELLIVWLMDTVNILTTFLSAPAVLPLPARGRPLVERAVAVCTMADRISTALGGVLDVHRTWDTALAEAKAVAE